MVGGTKDEHNCALHVRVGSRPLEKSPGLANPDTRDSTQAGASRQVPPPPDDQGLRGTINQAKAARGEGAVLSIGYAAGAYDLFHVGHLNLLRLAKQRCDYLIAGVVSDEMCELLKGVTPVIPEQERLEIVANIAFVDEAVLETLPDKLDTWRELGFTVFFKGDDWRGTPRGLDLEARFRDVGVSVEYFPYTLHTSSTKLRLALENLDRISQRLSASP